jgi:ParB family chromosome partitioning protein
MIGKRRALGRGLAALIPEAAPRPSAPAGTRRRAATGAASRGDGLRQVAIEDIHPARQQPRKSFDDERLEQLAESIRSQGIIQPLVGAPA